MTIPDELRRKLEALRKRGQDPFACRPEGCSAQKGPDPFFFDGDGPRPVRRGEKPVRLEDLIQGEITGAPERPCYRIDRVLGELFDRADELTREFRSVWTQGRHALTDEQLDGDWRDVVEADPKRLLFLDIETCGLTSTPVFLIGTMYLDDDGRFRLRQFFARDYAEEVHVLGHLSDFIRDFDMLVTFNGKSFDWPYLVDRAVYHSLRMHDDVPSHLDLLHEARRRWKTVLPNCRLQTLEYHVSGRRRVGDLPGSMIPDAYHRYVKTGNARQMLDVIHHNALDLITMAELMLFIVQGGDLTWE